MLFTYKKSRKQEESTRCAYQIRHRLMQRHLGPNHPALENYSRGYSAPSRQLCACMKRCSLSFGNCNLLALTARGHSVVAGLTAWEWRWCLWKWTIRFGRYKRQHPPFFWEMAGLCGSGVGSSPLVSCVVAQRCLECLCLSGKWLRKVGELQLVILRKGVAGPGEMKQELEWKKSRGGQRGILFKVSVRSAAACCDMLMPFAVGLQTPLKLLYLPLR